MSDNTEPTALAAISDDEDQSVAVEEQPKIGSRRDLARYIGIPLRHLADVLYEADRSRFYTVKTIPKASGGTRTLHAVSGKLKQLQRKALDKLQRDFPPSDRAHGFVPGRSIITNAIPHRRKKLVVKLDIVDFFPSIRFARVFGMFQAPPFRFGREAAMTLAQLACVPEHNGPLPQGGVLSPYIANVICRRMDQRLASIARAHRCSFTRYADDLTFSTNDVNRLDTEQLIGRVQEVVEREGFAINAPKTRVLRQSDRQIVTGIVVNDGLNVSRKYLRSLRAILHNIEKDGIEAQLIKDGGLKDRRASRLELVPDGDGYRLGKRELTKEQAVERFLQHLVGRFAFVGQVVNAEGQGNQQVRYKRVVLYKRLLKRFHSCVRTAAHLNLGEGPKHCERAIRSLMKRYPSPDQESEWYRRAYDCRRAELERWRDSPNGQRIRSTVMRIKTDGELRHLIAQESASDIRYWDLDCGKLFVELKSEVENLSQYPGRSFDRTQQVLRAFKTTAKLGGLTHQGGTPASLLQILLDHYEPHYYRIPNTLKKLVDSVSDALRNIALQDSEEFKLDLAGDQRTKDAVKALKLGTRLKKNPHLEGHSGTIIEDLLSSSHKEALKDLRNFSGNESDKFTEHSSKQPDPWTDRLRNPSYDIYTVVPALWRSLVHIFHSMYIHGDRGAIEVHASMTGEGCFQIRIADPSSLGLRGRAPGRDFAHGKLRGAASHLSDLAGYWIFARFDGVTYRVNMLTGQTVKASAGLHPGFSHIIVLPSENGYIEEPTVGEPATEDTTPLETARVLIIDNNERRRTDNVERWRALPNVALNPVAGIDPESYASGEWDLVLVHESNPESTWIDRDLEDRWPVVFFSNGNTVPCEAHEGRWYVSDAFLEEHFAKLVDKIVREGGKDCVGLS